MCPHIFSFQRQFFPIRGIQLHSKNKGGRKTGCSHLSASDKPVLLKGRKASGCVPRANSINFTGLYVERPGANTTLLPQECVHPTQFGLNARHLKFRFRNVSLFLKGFSTAFSLQRSLIFTMLVVIIVTCTLVGAILSNIQNFNCIEKL